jgi:hypothetical protein
MTIAGLARGIFLTPPLFGTRIAAARGEAMDRAFRFFFTPLPVRCHMLRSAIVRVCVAFLAAVSVLSGTTRAQSTTFTDRAAFEASLPAGFYFRVFSRICG